VSSISVLERLCSVRLEKRRGQFSIMMGRG
jgi:hypothetical protein